MGSFFRGLSKFAKGFERGANIASEISRRQYIDEQRANIHKPTDADIETTTTPLDDGGGGKVNPSTGGGDDDLTTKSKDAPKADTDAGDDTLTGGTGADTLSGSAGKDQIKGGGGFIQNVYNYYRSKGLSHAAAAGFAGNFMQESGGAQDVIEGRRKGDAGQSGYIGQWQGKRQNNLHAFARERGHGSPTLQDQLDFALEEGKPDSPYRDDVWANKSHLLNSAKSPEEATALIRKYFERPSAQDLGKRTKYALMAARGGGGGFQDSGGGGGGEVGTGGGTTTGDRRVAAGAIPDPLDIGGGDGEDDLSDVPLASAQLKIDAPSIDTSTEGIDFGLPQLDTDWAKGTMFAEGGAIPDDNQFGWGSILGKNLLQGQGGTGADATAGRGFKAADLGNLWGMGANMLGGRGGFNRATASGANYGPGAPSYAAGYSRDAADAAARTQPHWQAAAPAQTRQQADLAQYNAEVARQAAQARLAAQARADDLAADAARKAAMDKVIADKAAAQKAAIAKDQAARVAAKKKADAAALEKEKAAFGKTAATTETAAVGGGGGVSPAEVAWQIKKATWPTTHGGQQLSETHSPTYTRLEAKAAQGLPLTAAEINYMNHANKYMYTSHRQEGGIIPEPGETVFKKGGKVQEPSTVDDDGYFTKRKTATNRDERFKQLLAEEERGGRGGYAQSSARDRAARRLSAEEGRPSSTAYRPGGGAARREATPVRTRRTSPEKTSSTYPEPTPGAAGTPLGGYEPGTEYGSSPDLAVSPPHEKWGGRTTDDAPRPQAAGTPTEGYEPGAYEPAIPEPAAADTTAANPPVQETGPGQGAVVPPITGGGVDRTKEVLDAQRRREQEQRDRIDASIAQKEAIRAKFPNAKLPAAATPPRAAGTPTGSLEPTGNFGAIINAARAQLTSGRDPAEIARTLNGLGVPPDMWPQGIPKPITPPVSGPYDPGQLNKQLGFEKGGAIPDPEDGGGSMFAGVDNEAAAEGRIEKLQPTPKLRNDLALATHGGLQFLKRTFGLGGGDGAIATPDDAAIRAQGAQRMAAGEGAADDQEIAEVDAKLDPGNKLAESDRAMLRMAKIYQWYLEQGRKDEAEGAAASLMQFGAQRTARIGSLAAAAYSKYRQSGDQNDLDATAGLLEKAYDMIPNGGNADITIGEGGSLQVAHTDADGNTTYRDIAPNEIPGLLKSAMDGSGYWSEIAKVADPKGYESKLTSERQRADDARAQREWDRQHGITRGEKTADEEAAAKREREKFTYEHDVGQKDKLEEEKRAAAQKIEDEKRANVEEERRKLRDVALEEAKAAAKGAEPKSDAAALPGALSDASRARVAYEADETPENKQQLDAAVTRLLKAYGYDASKVAALGYEVQETDMSAEAAPYPGWTLNTNAKDGKQYWVSPDKTQMTLATGG